MHRMRRAERADAAAMHAVHAAAVRTGCRGHYRDEDVEAWATRATAAGWDDDVARRDVAVAEDGRRVLGFGVLDPDLAELRALYVHPDAARLGVGAALLATLECVARLRGLRALRLDATLNAVSFYARAGWHAEGPSTRTIAPARDVACVAMTRSLGPLRVVLREEAAADAGSVRALHDAGGGAPSVVATIDARVVGHVAFRPAAAPGPPGAVLVLGALAVVPELRACGIGSRLVEEGLARCRESGAHAVVAPRSEFLLRFGFAAGATHEDGAMVATLA
jgi:putative acetyltransferase